MSALHERRDQIGVAEIETQLANLGLKEPLTQTPEPPSPDTEIREDDEIANPHIAQDVRVPTLTSLKKKLLLTSAQDAWWCFCAMGIAMATAWAAQLTYVIVHKQSKIYLCSTCFSTVLMCASGLLAVLCSIFVSSIKKSYGFVVCPFSLSFSP